MSRRLVPVLVVLAIVAAVVGGVALYRHSRLVIGVMLPLTGPDAPEGLGMRNGIQLAVDEVNARGGVQGKKVSLDILDAPTAAKAIEGAKELARGKVQVVEHGYDMDAWAAPRDVLRDCGIISVVPGTIGLERIPVATGTQEVRLLPFAEPQFASSARYAWDVLGIRKPMLVREHTIFGIAGVYAFRGGLSVIQKTSIRGLDTLVEPGDTTFPAVTERYRKEQNDYVLYAGHTAQAALVLKELRAAGYTGPFELAGHGPTQQFLELAKEQAEGALTTFPGAPLQDTDAGKAFLADYAAHGFREPPGIYGLFGYVTTQALLQAMEKSFLSAPSIWGALNHEEFDTAVGKLRFNYFASTYVDQVIYKVVNGQWKPIYSAVSDDPEHAPAGALSMQLKPYGAK